MRQPPHYAPYAHGPPWHAPCGSWPANCSPSYAASTGASAPPPISSPLRWRPAAAPLTNLYGIGDILAAKILSRTGAISRFRSAAAFASFAGVAPIEVSSGEVVRHRPTAPATAS